MNSEHLRTRLMIAAQKFANEIADALIETTDEPTRVVEREEKKTRRVPQRHTPAVAADIDPAAAAKAADALAKLGIRKFG